MLLQRNEYGNNIHHGGIMEGRKKKDEGKDKKQKTREGRTLREHEAFAAKRKLLSAFYFLILYLGVMTVALQSHQ